MFEVNGVYANRKGKYIVLEINPPLMHVRYEDGSEAELKIDVQERIWENISAEYEAKELSRQARAARRGANKDTNYYIKVISVPSPSEMTFPGWAERVVMAPTADSETKVKFGDRLIFYALETRTFFAVATITGEEKQVDPKEYFFAVNDDLRGFYPIDIDASASDLERGAAVDSVELETLPNFKRLRLEAEGFYEINEDDFELLAEALTEVVEEEEEELDEDEDLYDEDDED